MGPNGRLTHEVYRDILRAIHALRRLGESPTLSKIGYRASVPNNRLRKRLEELGSMGFIDKGMVITQAGYGYVEDCARYLDPFLQKYGQKPEP